MNGTKVRDMVLDEDTQLPKRVVREVVRVASSEHEAGWRYDYKDNMVEGEHQIYEGPVEEETKPEPVSAVNQKGVKAAKAANPVGWGENA